MKTKKKLPVIFIIIFAILIIAAGLFMLSMVRHTSGVNDVVDSDFPMVEDMRITWDNDVLQLSWSAVDESDITGYEIWKSSQTDDPDSYELVATVKAGQETSYVDSDSDPQVVDFYKVRVYQNVTKYGFLHNTYYGEYTSGLNSVKLASRLPIISYHHLCDADVYSQIADYATLYVPDTDFDEQMKWLKDNGWRTLSTDEVADWRSGKIELPYKSTLITFDDGCYSVVKFGLPVLQKYNQKAVIFFMGESTTDTTDTECYDVYKYHTCGKDVINQVRKSYPNLEFQSHTWGMHERIDGHKPLNVMTKAQMVQDVAKMYDEFGCTAIAYPWGKYNDDFYSAVAENGHYKIGFTYGSSHYATRKQKKFALKRIKIKGGRPMYKFTQWYDGTM